MRSILAVLLAGILGSSCALAQGRGPFVEGGTFVMPVPPVAATPAGAVELLDAVRADSEPAGAEGSRGSEVTAPAGSIGRLRLYQYTNSGVEAAQQYNACGQAAMATVLSNLGVQPEDSTNAVMREVYRKFPPDIVWGRFGTSFKRVERGLTGSGVTWRWEEGEAALLETLKRGEMVVVMLDIGATVDEGWGPIGGHWVVIYAADQRGVYLSNWPGDGHCTWHSLRRSWDTLMTRAFYGAAPWQSHRWFLVPSR